MTIAVADQPIFETFDLVLLWPDWQGDPWISAESELGAIHGIQRPGFGKELRRFARDDAWWFRSAVLRGTPGGPRVLEFGELLRRLVFEVPDVARLYYRTKGAATAARRTLLVRLLTAPESLASLPWELMLDPEDPSLPLVFRPDTVLARSPRVRAHPLRLEPVAPPLNMLLVLSNPKPSRSGEALDVEVPFDHYEEGRALLAELAPLVSAGLLRVDVENRPSIENLRRRVGSRERGYHVVHYLGHAGPDKLKLEGNGGAIWLESRKFTALMSECPDLRLVFYAGCRTASIPSVPTHHSPGSDPATRVPAPTIRPALLSVADRSARDACQNVIGMQAALPFQTERVLTRFFYRALCTGATIGSALSTARAAVRDDETLGRELLNWAVPTLLTSRAPGHVLEPNAAPASTTAPPRQRAQLKLGAVEQDREFFARFSQLQDAVAVLRRDDPRRVVWVTGPERSGKSRLLDRALEESASAADITLYCRADTLVRGDRHPVEQLAALVTELVRRSGRTPIEREEAWDVDEWWGRVIESIADIPTVLVIDHIDDLVGDQAVGLAKGLQSLVARRSLVRLALGGGEVVRPGMFPDEFFRLVAHVHVTYETMHEIVGWVRRNRPALGAVLAQMPEADLASLHNRLGFDLQRWGDLARIYDRQVVKNLERALGQLMSAPRAPTVRERRHDSHEKRPGVLRVALVGPFGIPQCALLADSLMSVAQHMRVGGRVVLGGGADSDGAIAELIAPPISTSVAGTAVWGDDQLRWLKELTEVPESRPDIAVFVGAPPERDAAAVLTALADQDQDTLMIVAAPDAGDQAWPVPPGSPGDPALVVGALTRNARAVVGGSTDGSAGDVHLFADGTVDIPLSQAMHLPDFQVRTTTLPALNTLAAALVVLTVDPRMRRRDVGSLLLRTALSPVKQAPGVGRLHLNDAVREARRRTILRTLRDGARTAKQTAVATGTDVAVTEDLLSELAEQGLVRRVPDGFVAVAG